MRSLTYPAAFTSLLLAAAALAAAGRLPDDQPGVEQYCRSAQEGAAAGRIGPSVVAYNRAIALSPGDPRPYIGLAVLYEALERSDLAVETLEQLQAANPAAAHLPCRLAEANLGAEDVRAALALSQQAVLRETDCARAWSVLGISLARQRQWLSAAQALQRAQGLAPDDSGIADTLIEVHLQRGDHAGAIAVAQAQLAKQPRSARLHYKIGWAYARLPQTPAVSSETERWLRRAAELDPAWFEPWAELGRWQSSMGRVKEATASFERAWKLSPRVPGVAYNLARLWRTRGDPRAALMQREFDRLLRGQARLSVARYRHNSVPEEADAAVRLSELEGRLGQLAPALHRLGKALRRDPTNLPALRLYLRLERQAWQQTPDLLRPGPGIAPAQL